MTGEAILGATLFRDPFASIRDIVGGRSGASVQALRAARAITLQEMAQQAAVLGANAVVGIDIDDETITMVDRGGMLMVTASGAAVTVA